MQLFTQPTSQSIEEELADFGIRHERLPNSESTGKHALYQNDMYLGDYDAHEACKLLQDLRR
jgi:hypothetical protein